MDIEFFLERLGEFSGNRSAKEGQEIAFLAHQLWAIYSDLEKENLITLAKILAGIDTKCSLTSFYKYYFLSKILNDSKIYEEAFRHWKELHVTENPFHNAKDLALHESVIFKNDPFIAEMTTEDHVLYKHELYYNTVAQLEKKISESNIVIKKDFELNRKAVVLAAQLIGVNHGPTRSALTIAKLLKEIHGFDVLVISALEAVVLESGTFLPLMEMSVVEQYSQSNSIEFLGTKLKLFQSSENCFNLKSIKDTLSKIDEFDPSLIVSTSMFNFTAELVGKARYVVRYPTGSGLPFIVNNNFIPRTVPTEHERLIMEKFNFTDKYLFTMYPGFYPQPKTDPLDLSIYGIPEGAFVFCIVSTRLNIEFTKDYKNLLKKLIKNNDVYVLCAGKGFADDFYTDYPELVGRVKYIGYLKAVSALYQSCNAYINISKHGGGGSIVYAMGDGLPALSFPEGDAGQAVEGFPVIESFEHMLMIAERLVNDDVFYVKWKEMTKERCKDLFTRDKYVASIVNEFEKYALSHEEDLNEYTIPEAS